MHWQTADEEIARLLARRLEASGQPLDTRVTVAELHRVLLPYHECREALGFATKAEYDVALLRFLKHGRYVGIDETGLAKAVEEELSSPEPGLAFLKHYAAAQLHVHPPEEEARGSGPAPTADEASASPSGGAGASALERDSTGHGSEHVSEDLDDAETAAWLEALEPPSVPRAAGPKQANGRDAVEAACRSCAAPLPGRAELRFCPHCGADQRLRRCGRCGEDLELEWVYCPRCGGAAKG